MKKIFEETKRISVEDAIEFINNDMFSLKDAHQGFLTDGNLPFKPPIVCDRGIVVWPPADIHPSAEIGNNVVIGRYTNICGDCKIGDRTRIQGFCFIPDSIVIGKNVFIGPGVIFANVKYPQVRTGSLKIRDGVTKILDGASIGAGAIILPGITICENALIGAGAVVTKNVGHGEIVVGCPAIKLEEK